jgi:hypothetical protein
MQKIISIFAASILVLSGAAYADGKKIVKWVDGSGVTHYGDKLPTQEAGRINSEMNNQGVILKQNNVVSKKNEALDQENLEKERKDKILLASYTKADEIDLARDRNLQMDQANMQALTQQKVNITTRTARNNKTAEGFRARKKPLPPYLSQELKLSKTESANIDKQLAQRKLSMEATRKHYAEEKARFIALKNPDGAPAAVIESTTKPADAAKAEAAPAPAAVSEAVKTSTPTAPKPVSKTTAAKPQ